MNTPIQLDKIRIGLRKIAPAAGSVSRSAVFFITCICTGIAIANPNNPTVVAGTADFNAIGNQLQISNSPGAIINWQGFSIGRSEITRFMQLTNQSAVLNRVIGNAISNLEGELSSNGRVFLINSNGIVIGNGARIDTAGFVGSTLDITDQDFLSGNYRFSGGGGAISNRGAITTGPGGEVVLIAPSIENSGTINTLNGEIILAAGREVTLTSLDSENISFRVSAPGNKAVNLGSLVAQNGAIGVFANQVINSGSISANRVSQDGAGRIVLLGDSSTGVSGSVNALGEGTAGGEIHILGNKVSLNNASVDVTGASGGRVLIGGDFQGQGNVPRARTTDVDQTSVVHADAQSQGDGGEIIVWSESSTRSFGRLTARGGTMSGNGGLVETSSRGSLDFGQPADVSASNGAAGTWLLDPEDILIDSGRADSISSALNGGSNVQVKTSDTGTGEGNITVAAPIRKTEGDDASLGLIAHSRIDVNAPIESTAGKLNVSLKAGRDISVNAGISTNGGNYSATISPDLATPSAPDAENTTEQGSVEAQPDVTEAASSDENTASAVSAQTATASPTEETDAIPTEQSSHAELNDSPETVGHTNEVVLLASVNTSGGDLLIDAGRSGLLTIESSLSAANSTADSIGGTVQLLGNQVGLFEGASVDASGTTGGGTVLVGGDQQGMNPEVPNATAVFVDPSATIRADALDDGDGGTIIVFAEEAANIHGSLSAQGGAQGGDGGFIETSGGNLNVTRTPDTSSPNGEGGTWLIDPYDIDVVAGTGNSNISAGSPFESSGDTAQLGVELVGAGLALGDVTIQTGGGGGQAGDINWLADLDLDDVYILAQLNGPVQPGTLTLEAHNDILFEGSLYDSDIFGSDDIDENVQSLVLIADSDNINGGDVIFNASNRDAFADPALRIHARETIQIRGNNLNVLAGDNEDSERVDIRAFEDLNINVSEDILVRSNGSSSSASVRALGDGSEIIASNLTIETTSATGNYADLQVAGFGDSGNITLSGKLELNRGDVRGSGNIDTTDLEFISGVIGDQFSGGGNLNTSGEIILSGDDDKRLAKVWNIADSATVVWSGGDIITTSPINNAGDFDAQSDNAILPLLGETVIPNA
ncbi:MAG: filamentous hemagglutinin N-terminal domain-containing protein, partial [bacterium]